MDIIFFEGKDGIVDESLACNHPSTCPSLLHLLTCHSPNLTTIFITKATVNHTPPATHITGHWLSCPSPILSPPFTQRTHDPRGHCSGGAPDRGVQNSQNTHRYLPLLYTHITTSQHGRQFLYCLEIEKALLIVRAVNYEGVECS